MTRGRAMALAGLLRLVGVLGTVTVPSARKVTHGHRSSRWRTSRTAARELVASRISQAFA